MAITDTVTNAASSAVGTGWSVVKSGKLWVAAGVFVLLSAAAAPAAAMTTAFAAVPQATTLGGIASNTWTFVHTAVTNGAPNLFATVTGAVKFGAAKVSGAAVTGAGAGATGAGAAGAGAAGGAVASNAAANAAAAKAAADAAIAAQSVASAGQPALHLAGAGVSGTMNAAAAGKATLTSLAPTLPGAETTSLAPTLQ